MRKQIGKKLRFEVFKRDGFTCAYCGATPPSVILQVDHIHPVADGGTNDPDNLITSCQPCNIGKGANLLSKIPATLQQKAAMIKEQEEQLKAYYEVIRE
jgi:5-methylcytosine-specific restriction endonuclease McrA